MEKLKLFLLVAIVMAGIFSVHGQSLPIESQVDALFAEWNSPSKPGASVAVVQNGKVVFAKGYGMANLEYGIPNSPATVFHIASISKQFTAFAVLLLADEGKLSMDDDVRKFIPEVPDFGKTITLRHLVTHTSGMRDQWNLLAMAGWRLDDVITKDHVLTLVSRQKELNFNPGDEYYYCNTGFTLLAEVVARVSGKSFAEFTKERIFDPLKMTNTLFYDDHQKIVKNRAYSYALSGSEYKKSVLSYANVGATSLFTTVEDLALWAINFKSPVAGNKHIIEQMNGEAVLNNGKTFGGAMGQFVNKHKGLVQIQHGGADAGYRTYFGRFPDQDFAVIVFSNFGGFNPGERAMKIADLYLAKDYVEMPLAKTGKPKYKKLPAKQLESFSGNYWNEKERFGRRIYVKQDTLRYWRGENSENPLAPINDNTFQMLNVEADLKVRFESIDHVPTMIVVENEGEPSLFTSYNPITYSASELASFVGSYYSDELGTSYEISVVNDKLIASHLRTGKIEMTQVKDDIFQGNRWYFSFVEFVRNGDNAIIGCKVSSGRVRNLWFERR